MNTQATVWEKVFTKHIFDWEDYTPQTSLYMYIFWSLTRNSPTFLVRDDNGTATLGKGLAVYYWSKHTPTLWPSNWGFHRGSDSKECLQCRILGSNPWVKKIPWRRKWLPSPVFLPREFHRQWSLAGYSPLLKRTENICSQEDLHKTSHRTDLPRIPSSTHIVSSCVSWVSSGLTVVSQSFLIFSWSSVQSLVVSNSLWPHGLQYIRPPCPSPTPRPCSNSCPLNQWHHPTVSSFVIPFSSCLQSFPASGSFPMNQFFESGGQSIGASA